MSAMDIAQAMDEATLRRSPRRRSPDKSIVFDTAMNGAIPRSKSPNRASPERTSRSRSPIRKSQKQPPIGSGRLNLLGGAFQAQNQQIVSQNASKYISSEAMDLTTDKGCWEENGLNPNFPDTTSEQIGHQRNPFQRRK